VLLETSERVKHALSDSVSRPGTAIFLPFRKSMSLGSFTSSNAVAFVNQRLDSNDSSPRVVQMTVQCN
jgi:hypothetical protein